MSYHDLSESTLSPEERRREASEICELLDGTVETMKPNEIQFLEKMADAHEFVTTKQLFWLRDIKDKYL